MESVHCGDVFSQLLNPSTRIQDRHDTLQRGTELAATEILDLILHHRETRNHKVNLLERVGIPHQESKERLNVNVQLLPRENRAVSGALGKTTILEVNLVDILILVADHNAIVILRIIVARQTDLDVAVIPENIRREHSGYAHS